MKPRNIRCMKFFLALFNIIFILFGLVVMAISVINMRDRKSKPEQQSALSRSVLSFLFTLGLGLLVTAILGCVGSLRENIKVLYVYACFLIFLVSVEVVVGVGGAVLSAWMGSSSELRIQFYRNSTVEDSGPNQQAYWDNLQSENHCCGVDGPQDYEILHRDIPPSCCSKAHPLREGGARRHLHATCLSDRSYYMKGCEEALRQKKSLKGNIFISNGVIFTLLENHCCGVDGPQDYEILHRDIPPSCCSKAHPLREGGARRHLHATCLSDRSYYMKGCEEALRQKKSLKGNIFISNGVIFTLLEIVCIVLAFWMAKSVRNERRKLQQNLQAHFES